MAAHANQEPRRRTQFRSITSEPNVHPSGPRSSPTISDSGDPASTGTIEKRSRRTRVDRILLVDDDVSLTELLGEYLGQEGFVTECVYDGEAAVRSVQAGGAYTLVVLDVMLPRVDGFEALRRIRAISRIPVLMLSARRSTVDRITGLEQGADDYLAKPFDPRELVARVNTILRRMQPWEAASGLVVLGDLRLDPGSREVWLSGRRLDLTSAEFDLLRMLSAHAGEPLSRADLTRGVLDRELSAFDRGIDNLVSTLRRKLGVTPSGIERIKTIRGLGYQYISC